MLGPETSLGSIITFDGLIALIVSFKTIVSNKDGSLKISSTLLFSAWPSGYELFDGLSGISLILIRILFGEIFHISLRYIAIVSLLCLPISLLFFSFPLPDAHPRSSIDNAGLSFNFLAARFIV